MILITGGAGYIGSHINKLLNQKKIPTIVFDNLVYGHKEFCKWGEFVQGDLADIETLRSVFKKFQIQAVMHFAAYAYVGESVTDPQKYYLNNVRNALNLLQVMNEFNVKKFIFSSTCATYGVPQSIPLKENHPQNPINPYGRTKLMIEQILDDYSKSYSLKHVNLRYFNAAGADPDSEIGEWHSPETHLIPLVLDVALGKSKNIKIFGDDYKTKDGTCLRDYIHVNDLAQAHILALEYLNQNHSSASFNLGNGNGFSVKEIIQMAEKVTGKTIPAMIVERREGDPDVLIGDSTAARKTLGWKPDFASLEQIITTAWKWHQKVNQQLFQTRED